MTRVEILNGLRRQHVVERRTVYDGHNRRPLAISKRQLAHRRARRIGRLLLRSTLRWLNESLSSSHVSPTSA